MKFEVYKDSQGAWRWRLVAANGRIVANSGEAFNRKAGALHGVSVVKKCFDAHVFEVGGDAARRSMESAESEIITGSQIEPVEE